jgi:hypothetical protein
MTRRELFVPRRHCCFAILAAASLLTLLFAIAEVRLSRLPFQRDYGEGHVLFMSQQILDIHEAYKPLDSLPLVAFVYPPGYMVASHLAGALLGHLLAVGRILSLVSTLGIGMAAGLIILFSTPVRFPLLWRLAAAAFGGAAPFAAESVQKWASLMRVDMLALFFMYSGLAVYIVLGKRERWQFAAGALFLLALFTKQTMLSAPLACLIFGLLTCPWRTIRVYTSLAVAGLAGVFWLNAVTQGGFLTHIVLYNRNAYSWRSAGLQVFQHIQDLLPSVVIGAAVFLGVMNPVAIRRNGWRRFLQVRCGLSGRAVLIVGLTSMLEAISMLTVGKTGSNFNYFLGWDISTGILCGLFLFRLLATWETRARPNKRGSLILVVLLVSAVYLPSIGLAPNLLPKTGFEDQAQDDAALIGILRATSGPVFSENLLLPFQAGKAVEVEPATLCYIANAGQWDEAQFLELLDRHYFRLIVAYNIYAPDRYTPAVAASIESAYVLQQRVGRYAVYRPADTATTIR